MNRELLRKIEFYIDHFGSLEAFIKEIEYRISYYTRLETVKSPFDDQHFYFYDRQKKNLIKLLKFIMEYIRKRC